VRQEQVPERWERRSAAATALRLTVIGAPVVASVAAAWVVNGLLPPQADVGGKALNVAALMVVSTIVLLLVDRIARRLLPMVTLLDLSMLFPDQAPSRVKVAREAARKRPIEEQLRRVRAAGADPGAVAHEILSLVAALSVHDKPTRGHAERVRMFTDLLAEEMRVPARDRDLLRWAALLHDIGKLQVPATLLNKPAKPTEDEWVQLKAHPSHGADIAAGLLPWLGEWGDVIVQHHERYDGTGYPTGLAGRGISLGARIVSVADAYDVMTAARAYKRPVSRAAACKELVKWSGAQFDPVVVRAMVAIGAPRLRRAQGLVAWLADIPLVATTTVPAATVARVVGASALATGTVAGGVAVADEFQPPPRERTVAAADRDVPSSSPTAGKGRDDEADRPATDAALPDVTQPTTAPAAEPTGGAEPATVDARGPGTPPGSSAPGTTGPRESSSPVESPVDEPEPVESPVKETVKGAVGGVKDTVDTVTGTVKDVVEDPVGTVTDTVDGTVGTVTGTVEDVVQDPVGTVGDVVEDPVGTVDDVVDGVLGGGGSGGGGGGGLVGGLLGGGRR
jgi:putative nucleotidyltransferase with HDIG domain